MASRQKSKLVSDGRRDLISELPAEVKDRILEYLSTRDAVRTSLLSTRWKNVWLGHDRLVFNSDFFKDLKRCKSVRKCKGDEHKVMLNIINDILFYHTGPVKKFTVGHYWGFETEQSDIDRWCRFLSRNGVEELNIFIDYREPLYSLPISLVSCATIKKLKLEGFSFGCMPNAHCIFPNVTSLAFGGVDFEKNVNQNVYSIPNLEELGFRECAGIHNFLISAPKFKSLSVIGPVHEEAEWRWFLHHFEKIQTLCVLVAHDVVVTQTTFPTAINLQVIKLHDFSFASESYLRFAMLLLQKSPNLCDLEIVIGETVLDDDVDGDCCFINHDMKMLKTVKINLFGGSRCEMIFVKSLLLKSRAVEKIVIKITDDYVNDLDAFKISRELLCSPRASQKALVFIEYPSACDLGYVPELLDGFINDSLYK